jgi:hypothetical protein
MKYYLFERWGEVSRIPVNREFMDTGHRDYIFRHLQRDNDGQPLVLETMEEEVKACMWEILIPTEKRVKTPRRKEWDDEEAYAGEIHRWEKRNSYSTRYHKVWDEKVRAISGGLTIMSPAKGQWKSPCGELFIERMIPVRIMATREQIEQVIDMTLEYYDQLAVLCYKLSDEVILKHRK